MSILTCIDPPLLQNPFPAKLCLSFCLPLTLTCSSLFAVAIYKKVDVGHPVFAVVLQVKKYYFFWPSYT